VTVRHHVETRQQRIDNIRSWARRKREKGTPPTTDEIRAKINEKWPLLKRDLAEEIFNRVSR
jgi:hypothetical protein